MIGLALFLNQPIWFVVEQLQLVFGSHTNCAPSASIQARQRLGAEPLEGLFKQLSQSWQQEQHV